MLQERLLHLYPRAWRERYGEEFLTTVGNGRLHPQQVIDIVSGAIDAWLSADVRRTIMAARVTPSGGGPTMLKSLLVCERKQMNYTRRDSLVGAGVLLGGVVLLTGLGIALRRNGFPVTGEVLKSLGFPASLILSMPFWVMKGQPRKVQVFVVGVTLALLVALSYLATIL